MNDIGVVEIAVTRPIFFDSYADNRSTGSFILIDPATNATAAAGMIRRGVGDDTASAELKQPAAILLVPDVAQANKVEQLLLDRNIAVVRTRIASNRLWQALLGIGLVVLFEGDTLNAAQQPGEKLSIFDVSNGTTEELLAYLSNEGILSHQKGSRR
jgi:sulfate adenylyltransferase subunit 1